MSERKVQATIDGKTGKAIVPCPYCGAVCIFRLDSDGILDPDPDPSPCKELIDWKHSGNEVTAIFAKDGWISVKGDDHE